MHVRAIARILICSSVSLFLSASILLSGCSGSHPLTFTRPANYVVPSISLTVSPSAVLPGQSATLSWSTTSATSCTADGAWSGSPQTNGSINVTLSSAAAQTYSLQCTGTGGLGARSSVTLALSPADGACAANHAVAARVARHLGKRRPANGKRF